MAKKLATLSNLARFASNVKDKYAAKATSLAGYGIEDAYTKTEADAAVTDAIKNKADKATTLAGYSIGDAYTKTEADAAIDAKVAASVASAYKIQGSLSFADLPDVDDLTAADVGKVYNVLDKFTTTADFVEGANVKYPAGTNVVVVATGEDPNIEYKYDVLAGTYDLSPFVKNDDIEDISDEEIDNLFEDEPAAGGEPNGD